MSERVSIWMRLSSIYLPTGDHGVVGDPDPAYAVVSGAGHLSGAARAVAVEPVVGVPRVRVGVIAAEVVARSGILCSYVHDMRLCPPLYPHQPTSFLIRKFPPHIIINEVWMHVVDPVVHDCRGDVFARHPLSPGGRHIQVQLGLSTILAGVFLFRSKQLYSLSHRLFRAGTGPSF